MTQNYNLDPTGLVGYPQLMTRLMTTPVTLDEEGLLLNAAAAGTRKIRWALTEFTLFATEGNAQHGSHPFQVASLLSTFQHQQRHGRCRLLLEYHHLHYGEPEARLQKSPVKDSFS